MDVGVTILTKLGAGSYGAVYRCLDDNGAELAAKCVMLTPCGAPHILEMSLMASFCHPHLNRALAIQVHVDRVYILQELAQADLACYTRRTKLNQRLTPVQLRKWCWSLSQAVTCLHQHRIVHGDIKASNALLYPDGNVRLSDFTFSTRLWPGQIGFRHTIGTPTHRALECWQDRDWDCRADVWALGCTFYELAYGTTLFPYQGGEGYGKEQLRDRSINCLLDWGHRGPEPQPSQPYISGVRFKAFELVPEFHEAERAPFNRLVLRMLKLAPNDRPDMASVLSDPYFTGLKLSPYSINSSHPTALCSKEQYRLDRYLDIYMQDNTSTAKGVARELYARLIGLSNISEKMRAAGCAWLAHKLTREPQPELDISMDTVIELERAICCYLDFRLHTKAPEPIDIRPARGPASTPMI